MASSWRSVMAWRGSSGSDHSGDVGRGIEVEQPVADEQPDDGVQHRLRHGPAQQAASARVTGSGAPVEVLELRPGSARPLSGRDGRPRRHSVVASGPLSSQTRSSSVSSSLRTSAGGSPCGHSAVGHGTPSGWGGSGTRPTVVRHRPPVTQRRGGTATGRRWSRPASPAAPSGRRPRRGSCRGSRGAPRPWSRPRRASWC